MHSPLYHLPKKSLHTMQLEKKLVLFSELVMSECEAYIVTRHMHVFTSGYLCRSTWLNVIDGGMSNPSAGTRSAPVIQRMTSAIDNLRPLQATSPAEMQSHSEVM